MVQVQINLSNSLSKYIGIQKELYGVKTKGVTIVKMLEERYEKDKRIKSKLEGGKK